HSFGRESVPGGLFSKGLLSARGSRRAAGHFCDRAITKNEGNIDSYKLWGRNVLRPLVESGPMKMRQLGPEGPQVSVVGLGGMLLSITGRPPEDQSLRVIDSALDFGVTLFETSDAYA